MDPQGPIQNDPVVPIQPPIKPEVLVQPKKNLITPIILLIIGIILGIGGLLAYQKYFANKSTPTPSPTPEITSTPDPTADWKTYNDPDNKYSFKYPANLFAKESDEKNFIDIVKNENDPLSNAIISVDARLISPYLNDYETALTRRISDLGLINTQTVSIPNGVVISGTIAPDMGMAGGLKVTNGLIKYNGGAISIQYNNDNVDQATFYQILSTFKFTDQGMDFESINSAAKSALVTHLGYTPSTTYGVSKEDIQTIGNWTLGTIVIKATGEGGPDLYYFLGKKVNSIWQIAIEESQTFKGWVSEAPDGLINPDLKKIWESN